MLRSARNTMEDSKAKEETDTTYNELDSDDEFLAGDGESMLNASPVVASTPPSAPCIVCLIKPAYSKGGKSYPTCGFRCSALLEAARKGAQSSSNIVGRTPTAVYRGTGATALPAGGSILRQPTLQPVGSMAAKKAFSTNNPSQSRTTTATKTEVQIPIQTTNASASENCVVCLERPCRDSKYVTCGIVCAEKLCQSGSANRNNCNYCHRRPKLPGQYQCGQACSNNAKLACLLCKCRPKLNKYQLCGKTCRSIAIKTTPLILEAPQGHETYEMVKNKFKSSWSSPPGGTCPEVRHVYKIIESTNFLEPYNKYKKSVGNEVFRYHGTKRQCKLGEPGQTKICSSSSCALCSILRTSFKTTLANPLGAFGAGVYSSSASNKAYNYTSASNGKGAMLLNKVILGKVRNVNNWNEVMSAPPGYDSVMFDRQNGTLNETVVYCDDAIRPVFLIIF
ncbi:ADP-ribosylation [Agrocybe pediades]|nr:ADP-ribosylation [Agrocybe pediades]